MLSINDDLELRPFSLTIRSVQDKGHRVIVTADVVDSEIAEHEEVFQLTFSVALPVIQSPERRALAIRSVLAKCVMHEVNECLFWKDGTRVVEPHPNNDDTF